MTSGVVSDSGYQISSWATPLNRNELDGLKPKHITSQVELNQLEQANIEAGLRWVRRQQAQVLTDRFAVELHSRLFGDVWDWAGKFRQTGKNIGVDPALISVELRTLIDDAQYWVDHAVFPASEVAVRFHHRLVKIHLFPNGNGRHSRIMADAILERVYKAKAIDWAGGHDLQKMGSRRTAYIEALRAADRDDISLLVKFIGPRDDLS